MATSFLTKLPFFSSSTEIVEDIDNFNCPICLEIFEKPRKISCGHLFCKDCLKNYKEILEPACPVCRQLFVVADAKRVSDLEKAIHSSSYVCPGCSEKVLLNKLRHHNTVCPAQKSSDAHTPATGATGAVSKLKSPANKMPLDLTDADVMAEISRLVEQKMASLQLTNGPSELMEAKSFKMFAYMEDDPELWFALFDEHAEWEGVKDQQRMFRILLEQLYNFPSAIQAIRALILDNTIPDRFNKAKEILLLRYQDSVTTQFRGLFGGQLLGDRRPSTLLRKMRETAGKAAGTEVGERLLKVFFIKALPAYIRPHVDVLPDKLDVVACIANVVFDSLAAGRGRSRARQSPARDNHPQLIKELREDVSSLRAEIRAVSRSRFMSMAPRRRSSSRPAKPASNLCYYHAKFKEKARKCRRTDAGATCSFAGKWQPRR